ncbi:hypothetical protein B0O80DRAFT_454362 [Mortierella sp. GBAus27b]|nr:hypothetical protein B0O80DRAFT_454362 [Mortierella sp. GBAus27b]
MLQLALVLLSDQLFLTLAFQGCHQHLLLLIRGFELNVVGAIVRGGAEHAAGAVGIDVLVVARSRWCWLKVGVHDCSCCCWSCSCRVDWMRVDGGKSGCGCEWL